MLFLLLGASSLAGCGWSGGLVPVTGTVTLDGAPLEMAAVAFHPQPGVKGNGGFAATMAGGRFTLLSPQGKKGVFPGDYAVTVPCVKLKAKAQQQLEAAKAEGYTPAFGGGDMDELVPKAYAKPETRPLRVSVGKTGATVPIEIESSAKPVKPAL